MTRGLFFQASKAALGYTRYSVPTQASYVPYTHFSCNRKQLGNNQFAGFLLTGITSLFGMALIGHFLPNEEKYWIRTGKRDMDNHPLFEELSSEDVGQTIKTMPHMQPVMMLLPGVGTTHGSTAISVDNNSSGLVQADIQELHKMLGGYTSCIGKLFPSGPSAIISLSWGNALNARSKAYDPDEHLRIATRIFKTLSPLQEGTSYPLIVLGFSQGGSSVFPLKDILEAEIGKDASHPSIILMTIAPSKIHKTETVRDHRHLPLITIISPDDPIAEKPTGAKIAHLTDSQIYIEENPEKNSVTLYVRNRSACLEKEEDFHSLKSYLGCQLSRNVIGGILKEVSKEGLPDTTLSAIEIVHKVAEEQKWEVVSKNILNIQSSKETGKGR